LDCGLRFHIDMSRNHRRLRVFTLARQLTLAIYKNTNDFPRDEWFGMRLQIRRAAVSVGANIVEGSARRTTREYCNFLNIALGSASELAYLVELANELGFIRSEATVRLSDASNGVVRQLQRLVDEMEALRQQEEETTRERVLKNPVRSPKPEA
jgi:four helix bundle protein